MAIGHIKCHIFEEMQPGFTKHSKMDHLCPHARLASDFTSKKCKLTPAIFAHGYSFGAEEHMAFPMMWASHGYIIVSPTFMDGSAPHCTDKDGNNLFINIYNNGKMCLGPD